MTIQKQRQNLAVGKLHDSNAVTTRDYSSTNGTTDHHLLRDYHQEKWREPDNESTQTINMSNYVIRNRTNSGNHTAKSSNVLHGNEVKLHTYDTERQNHSTDNEIHTGDVWRYDPDSVTASYNEQHGAFRDVYIDDNYEEPVCPKVTLL